MRTPPNSVIPHQGVEDGEQLSHARYQSNLLWLASQKQPLVKLLDDGIVSSGDQGAHVEGCSDRSPATPHLPFAAPLTGVPIEGGDTDQGTQTLVGELAHLGQLGEQCAGENWADAGDALEQCLVGLESGVSVDGPVEVGVGAGEFLLEPLDVGPDSFLERSEAGGYLKAVVLRDEHAEDLASPCQKSLKELGFIVGDDAGGGFDRPGEAGEDESVYPIGFGERTDSLGEVSGLARVDDRHGNTGSGDGGGSQAFVATGARLSVVWSPRTCGGRDGSPDSLGPAGTTHP